MNFALMMKQAQQMQTKIGAVKDQLAQTEFTGTAGGGAVSVTLTGNGIARAVKIDSDLLKEGEADMLEDLLVAAINDAHTKSETASNTAMKDVMGGLNLPPGVSLPF